jgi:hypothetical protein
VLRFEAMSGLKGAVTEPDYNSDVRVAVCVLPAYGCWPIAALVKTKSAAIAILSLMLTLDIRVNGAKRMHDASSAA